MVFNIVGNETKKISFYTHEIQNHRCPIFSQREIIFSLSEYKKYLGLVFFFCKLYKQLRKASKFPSMGESKRNLNKPYFHFFS